MKEAIELEEQIKRLNEELMQRNAEKDALLKRIVIYEGKEVKYERKIREFERDCERKLKTANVRKWKIVKRIWIKQFKEANALREAQLKEAFDAEQKVKIYTFTLSPISIKHSRPVIFDLGSDNSKIPATILYSFPSYFSEVNE